MNPRPHTFGSANNWWHTASTEQRLAQIDGGIECGMTSRQIAIACGLNGEQLNVVAGFAGHHGRKFGRVQSPGGVATARRHNVEKDRSAYLRGDRVSLWGNIENHDEFALDEVTE